MENTHAELEAELLRAAAAFVLAGRRLDASIEWRSPRTTGFLFSGYRFLKWWAVRSMEHPAGLGVRQLDVYLARRRRHIRRTCPDLAELVGELLKELQAGPPAIETTKKYRPQPASVA